MTLLLAAVVAGVLIAQPAQAVTPDPTPQPFARRSEAVTARAHLVYKPDPATPRFEGNVVVVEQSQGLLMVIEQSQGQVVVDARGSLPPRRTCDPG